MVSLELGMVLRQGEAVPLSQPPKSLLLVSHIVGNIASIIVPAMTISVVTSLLHNIGRHCFFLRKALPFPLRRATP